MDRDLHGTSETSVLNTQTMNVIPTMNEFCSIHPGLRMEYMTVDPAQDFAFKCVNCISEENVPQSSLIPINLILTSEDKTIFANFPITDRSLAIELRTLALNPTTSEQVVTKISSFFKEFRAKLLHKLEIIEQKMTEKAKSISNFGSIFELYNSICSKNKLKAIVSDNEKEVSDKSVEIKAICSEILSKEQENNSSIRTALEKLKTLQSAIDFETPNKLKEYIFSQVDKIDIFLVDDFIKFQESVDQKDFNKNLNIQKLMKLVNNKFNGISVESSKIIEESLNRISVAFSAVEVPEIGGVGTYLESLSNDQIEVIQKLIEDLSKNQQAIEADDQRESKEKLLAADLIKIIRNKANFCSLEYIEDVSQVANTLERLIGLFLVRPPKIKIEEQGAFNYLNENQLFSLTNLAIKTNQITQQHRNSYLDSKTPQPNIQDNSKVIRKLIGKTKEIDQQTNQASSFSDSLDKILVTYPIFELLPPITNKLQIIPIPISFTKTNLYSSQEIQISQNGRSVELRLDPSKMGQVVTNNILDNQLGYLLKVKFSKPISAAKSCGYFMGLIPNSSINSKKVLCNSHESGFCNNLNEGAKTILKGGRLTSSELRNTADCFEFRFCISKQLFLYADSSYSNINQVENNFLNPEESYRFGIFLENVNRRPSDMFIEICEFGIIDPDEITNFQ